ncbi:uroporphyrinogen-III synthase [Enterovirga rhinocerotis]|uniref:Uroporphyrinogen-III synthase n=1 Tax=Enterovirga rhinocerotis TaxID=1339210 RepID=A0A4R7BWL6_9HYPH|nr:uroporphyrinogen-III synthase [Enterovirga rhinocerotis]TDR89572.1 uroporphyrinogen-III synthase [Enterovirga rhinocerotis]
MRVLVGRPPDQAEATARALVGRGHEAVLAPLLAIVPTGHPPHVAIPAAILVTSANAVPALATHLGRFRDVPIHAVGPATAEALLEAGFARVVAAQDGKTLARAVGKAFPRGAALLRVAGIPRRDEPEASLRRAGFDLSVWEVYETRTVAVLPDVARTALAEGSLDTILHYSPRSAETLVRLAAEAGLAAALLKPVHLCLSRAVAAALDGLGPIRIAVARRPDEAALLDLIERAHLGPIDARARARLKSSVRQGTNPPTGTSQPAKDDGPSMSDTRRDPLRRTPPTIDLKAEEVAAKDASAKDAPGKGGSTTAAGGTDASGKPDTSKTQPPATAGAQTGKEAGSGEAKPGEPKPGEAKPPEAKNVASPASPPKPAGATPSDGKPSAGGPTTSAKPDDKGASAAAASSSASAKADTPKSGAPFSSTAAPSASTAAASSSSVPASGKPGATGPSTSSAASSTATPGLGTKPAEAPATGSSKPADAASSAKGPSSPASAAATSTTKPSSATPASGTAAPQTPATDKDRTPPPAAAEPRRGGSGAVFAAGLGGGLLGALLTAGALQFLPNTGADERLAALERRIAEPGTIEPRIAALESGLRQAGNDAKAARAAAETAGKQAAEALGRPAGTTAVAGPDQEARASIQALTGRVDETAKRLDETAAGVAEAAKKADEATAAAARFGPITTSIGQTLETLAGKTTEGLAAGSKAIEALNTHVRSLQTDVGTLRTGTATLDTRSADAEKRLTTLTDGLGRVSADLAKLSPAAIQAGLRVVVAGRLDDAMRSGAPLKPAIAALTKLGTEPALLAPLQPYAEAAAPSASTLAAEFKPLADAMTAVPAQPDESWLDKGKRLVGKVVTVRAIGDGSGSDVPGLIARIESSLARGAVGEAKAAWDKLPEDKRRVSATFGERLGGRAAAEDAARRIGAQSLAALDAATR